jgi:folylpolyglutamate synthase
MNDLEERVACANLTIDHVSLSTNSADVKSLSLQKEFAEKWQELDSTSATTVKVLPSVEDAFEYVQGLGDRESKVHAFVTGSVHLVGRALGALEGADAL